MKIFILLITSFLSVTTFGATCTSTTRNNYVTNQVLTSSALNADFNQLVTKANAFDGGCVTAGTLEYDSLNTTQFAPILKGVKEGCKVSYSNASTVSIGKCLAAVNGTFVYTTNATTASFGCSGCSAEVVSTTYYVYIQTGSSATTLTPLILTTAPNEDGYDNSGNKVLARFYNNASSDIDQYSIDQWKVNGFDTGVRYLGAITTTGSWTANTTYTGKYWREGSALVGSVGVYMTGAPTSAALTITLPASLNVDVAKLSLNTDGVSTIQSSGQARDNGSAGSHVWADYRGTATALSISTGVASGTYEVVSTVTQAIPFTFGNTDSVNILFKVPIVGWED